ncbi:hypothetical protein DBV15_00514 [Temnothorax longispinosus]|uniref:Uncharacterized protein n=1 Tax=Temnothorax longispinosus TaxID=300112 RepID=A0A4S2KSQ2_9HYME|nr:hypothetical protein DBV15_00514 [Temnothorax longispinosus]
MRIEGLFAVCGALTITFGPEQSGREVHTVSQISETEMIETSDRKDKPSKGLGQERMNGVHSQAGEERERKRERERGRGPCNRVVETGSVRLVETQGEETPMVLVLGNQYGYGARHTGEGTRAKATYSCIFMCPPKKAKDKSVVGSLDVGTRSLARAGRVARSSDEENSLILAKISKEFNFPEARSSGLSELSRQKKYNTIWSPLSGADPQTHLPHLSALEDTADCPSHFIARTALTVLSLKNGRAVARGERTTLFGNLMRYFARRHPFCSHFVTFPAFITKCGPFKKPQFRNTAVFEDPRPSSRLAPRIATQLCERDTSNGKITISTRGANYRN